ARTGSVRTVSVLGPKKDRLARRRQPLVEDDGLDGSAQILPKTKRPPPEPPGWREQQVAASTERINGTLGRTLLTAAARCFTSSAPASCCSIHRVTIVSFYDYLVPSRATLAQQARNRLLLSLSLSLSRSITFWDCERESQPCALSLRRGWLLLLALFAVERNGCSVLQHRHNTLARI
uniref:Uncharacterized protein n=1 Tax=Anopheles atroparvus TaxID=41427 RepID=A0AAG5CYI3_ANOAO